jgi:hypothetical protein
MSPDDDDPNDVVRFRNADEFRVRPWYRPAITCAHDDLKRIVGPYDWEEKDQLKCGLNGCDQVHWHGFLIRTKDGRETHCGTNCVQREFPDSWAEAHRVMKEIDDRQTRFVGMQALIARRQEMLAVSERTLADLRRAAGQVETLFREMGKEPALSTALDECLQEGGRIRVEARVDSAFGADQPGNKRNIETIATLNGASAVKSVRVILHFFQRDAIAVLLGITQEWLDCASPGEIKKMSLKLNAVHAAQLDAERSVKDVGAFFRPSNLRKLVELKRLMPRKTITGRTDRVLRRVGELDFAANAESEEAA